MYDNKIIIGNNALITVAGIKDVPAKIDTGANSSSIWASNIKVNEDRELEFTLFAPESEFYTGEKLTTKAFRVRRVRNSTGDEQLRYRVELPVVIEGKEMVTGFTLADRSRNNFPILIGRRTLKGEFLVDVEKLAVETPGLPVKGLNKELDADPLEFHKKYMENTDLTVE